MSQQWGGQSRWGGQQSWGGHQQPWQQAGNPWGSQQQLRPPMAPQPYRRAPNDPPPQRRRGRGGLIVAVLIGILATIGVSILFFLLVNVLDRGPSSTEPSSTTTSTSYVNEDYEAPPADFDPAQIPIPDTYAQAERWLTHNKAYTASVPTPVNCGLPKINPKTASATELEAHFNQLTACLMKVWDKPLQDAGYEMPRPPVTVYTSKVQTACGTLDKLNAAYCAGDQRIYYAKPLLESFPTSVQATTFNAEMVIAHEFGHAVQARTGILISERALSQRLSKDEALVMSRRTETQADCFAGMFVGSVARSQKLTARDLAKLADMAYSLGDDVMTGKPNYNGGHGLGVSRQAWFNKGLNSSSIGTCNTYTASASSVR